MAIFEQGVNRRSNNSNSKGKKDKNLFNYTLTPARVTDIILDENHPKYNTWNDIGNILFEYIDDTITTGQTNASPTFPQFKSYPLVNEIVFIIAIPNNIDYDTRTVSPKFFYFNPIGIWDNPHNNASPSSIPFSQLYKDLQNKTTYNQNSVGPEERGEQNEPVVHLNSQNNSSQNTFVEKSNIYPLMPFMGDNIIEGRYGQSVRLGHTAKSNSSKKNNWSESGENGDPIMILRNGQSPKVNEAGWVPITENIKDDLSSIYLTSTQKLPFSLANENFISYTTPPELPSNYIKPQILLNSNRVIINAKNDSTLISGNKSVGIFSNQSINLESKKINIHSTDIRLGDKNAKESVLKGDIAVEYLKLIIQEIANISNALKTIQIYTGPNVVGVPDPSIQPVAKSSYENLNKIKEQIDTIKSNFVKTI
tara:strand:- start:1979 stop:3247 length:1269 start_codon:yes stop_codon:yes gene_type:complete